MTARLAEMTSAEAAAAVSRGATTVILPLGAVEQHGAHLPLGTDAFRAETLAEALGDALADAAVVAPVLPIGCSDEHTGFAGLLGLDHDTLTRVVVDCARRMAAWGVRRLVLLSAHGGNLEALQQARARLRDEVSGLEVVLCTARLPLAEALRAIAEADGVSMEARGLHAGEAETSEMLSIRPDLVRTDRLGPGYVGPFADILPELRRAGVRAVSPSGVLGDPRPACARRGVRYLQAQVGFWHTELRGEDDADRRRERRA